MPSCKFVINSSVVQTHHWAIYISLSGFFVFDEVTYHLFTLPLNFPSFPDSKPSFPKESKNQLEYIEFLTSKFLLNLP